jgi:hypothetical protein
MKNFLIITLMFFLWQGKAFGYAVFAKTIGGSGNDFGSIYPTPDGGWIMSISTNSFSGNYDIYLIKMDGNFNIQWRKRFYTSQDVSVNLQPTSDGGYILGGTIGAGSSTDVLLVKIDANGNIQWAKRYGWSNFDLTWRARQTSDGGYIIAGLTNSFGNYRDPFLLKVDANGNVQWVKRYYITGNDWFNNVIQTPDGGYIVGGTYKGETWSSEILLVKTDANGNVQWAKLYGNYGSLGRDEGSLGIKTSDGGYILGGFTDSFGAGTYDWLIIKVSSTGAVQWAKTYGGLDWDLYPGAIQTSDGGFAIFGSTESFGSGSSDFMIIKTDAYGNPQWAKTYGGTAGDGSYGINQTSDGGFVFAGGTGSFGVGGGDVFFVRTDANGNIGSCPIVQNVSPSVTSPSINVTNISVSTYSPTISVSNVSLSVSSPSLTENTICYFSSISEQNNTCSYYINYKDNKLHIKLLKPNHVEFKVYSTDGKLVYNKTLGLLQAGEYDYKLKLRKGVYFLRIRLGDQIQTLKVAL